MVQVNLDDKKEYPKTLIDVDSYQSEVMEIGDTYKEKGYQTEKEEEKFVINFKIQTMLPSKEDPEVKVKTDVLLPLFMKTVITKGSGTYSNSKLYDFLEKSDLLKTFKSEWPRISLLPDDKQNEAFINFFKDRCLGKICKIMTKTVKKGTPEAYSVVGEIIKFL